MIKVNREHHQLAALRPLARQHGQCPQFKRAWGQLRFLCTLSDQAGGAHDSALAAAARRLAEEIAEAGTATLQAVARCEESLAFLAEEAKSYEYLCVAHAHIDMNWMWGYDETVSVTLDTVHTMLALLEEYPDYVFSQSQASVYAMVEQYAPEMFAKIRQYIKEGRWEVTASTWVEGDKNMAAFESQLRQQLYAKAYFREKFGIDPGELAIDFEPDTFGHHRNVPEILSHSGVQFYYHCRGQIGEDILYRWAAPSGSDVIVYTEPFWYITELNDELGDYAAALARITGSRTLLRVYGVGDHGGGPTRRDLDSFREMNTWPLFPKLTFSTLRAYFERVKPRKDTLPLLADEINAVCDGCYTTQSVIKAGNRKSERLLREGEYYSALAAGLANRPYPGKGLREAWIKTLFNQFHDILPGSCTADSREAASGEYQRVFAVAESARKQALLAISSQVDTLALLDSPPEVSGSRGQGAGAGHGQCSQAAGSRRVFHLFNPLPWARRMVAPITVWDYEGDIHALAARDPAGKALALQYIGTGQYWAHTWNDILVQAEVPAGGYTSIVLFEQPDTAPATSFWNDMRVQRPEQFVLENEHLRVELDRMGGGIASFLDKETGAQLALPDRPAAFFFGTEAVNKQISLGDMKGMSAWFIGRWRKLEQLDRHVEITPLCTGPLRTAYRLALSFGERSSLVAQLSLDAGERQLRIRVECDWREFGSDQAGVPNLHFQAPLGYACNTYRYDVPGGSQRCGPLDMDRPAQSYVLGENKAGPALAILSRDKYGVRCHDNSLALTLLRGAYDPDPTPEIGSHVIEFALAAVPAGAGNSCLSRLSQEYRLPATALSAAIHGGALPAQAALMRVDGDLELTAVKHSEQGGCLVIRLMELEGKTAQAVVTLPFTASAAWLADAHERPTGTPCILEPDGKTLRLTAEPYSVSTVVVETACNAL